MVIEARFRAEHLTEIHRDPGGHYHHWSIAWGHLERGTLAIGDPVVLTARSGEPRIAHVLGFDSGAGADRDRTINERLQISSEVRQAFGLGLWRCAPQEGEVDVGTWTVVTPERRDRIVSDLIELGHAWCPCRDCASVVRALADREGLMSSIKWQPHAQAQLGNRSLPPSTRAAKKRRSKWWSPF